MKYMKLTIGIIPIAALVLCMSCNKSKQTASTATGTNETKTAQIASGKIVYVEIDTILNHYEMAKDMAAVMNGKSKSLDADLNSKSKTLQSAGLDFQNKVQKGLVTQAQAQEMQQQLASQEQGLYQLRDQYRMQLSEEAQVNQRKVINAIMEYLKEYNKTKGYQYILANQFPSSILYADSTLNITNDVIGGLNAKYLAEKKKAK
ncbi:MAG TPA: OmpH family outer membrane protein [Bacteroidales bacterium]